MDLFNIIFPALTGLIGVLVGGWIQNRAQRQERQHNRMRKQLDNFYSPLLGLRARILAKGEVRLKLHGATGKAWSKLVKRTQDLPVHERIKLDQERFPDFEKVIEEDNRQLVEDVMPLYREMIEIFQTNMGLTEPSTCEYFGALVEFVEIWHRWLDKTIPKEALEFLGHSEDSLHPFYDDLAENLHRLQRELKK